MSSVEIVRIAGRGDGVAEDGCYVPYTVPGDHVRPDGVVEPGPHHRTPPCRHFPVCGGCQLQHADDETYGVFLRDRILGALHAQNIDAPEIRAPHLSAAKTRRRVSLRAERKGRKILIGFNEGQSHRIVDLAQCEIMAPELFALIGPLRQFLGHLIADKRAATVQMTLADQGVDMMLEKVKIDGLAATEALTDFAQSQRIARLSIDQGYGPEPHWEPEPVTATLGGVAVPLPTGAFLQATADGEAALVAAVREAIGGSLKVADLFAGLGTFALTIPGQVLAVEGARDATLALKMAGARTQRTLAVEHRDLFRRPLTVTELKKFEAVVLDPPRAGALEQAKQLAEWTAGRIAYVSCNPATFARDAKMLIDGGWTIEWVQPVGQFRWSTHVELAALFTRA